MAISIQTFGSYAKWHPHLHALVTNGVMTPEGAFRDLPQWTPQIVEELFRRLVLERLARYALRAPVPFDAVELQGSKVRVKTPPDPRTGERDLLLDPLDWIHAVTLQVPDPRRHLVRYLGIYANRSRKLWQGRASGIGWARPGRSSARRQPRPRHRRESCQAPAWAAEPVCCAGSWKWIRSAAYTAE